MKIPVCLVLATSFALTCLSVPVSAAPDASSDSAAHFYARRLLRTQDVQVQYHAARLDARGKPEAHLYRCQPVGQTGPGKAWTIAVAPDRSSFPLLFYYLGEPVTSFLQTNLPCHAAKSGPAISDAHPISKANPPSESHAERLADAWKAVDTGTLGTPEPSDGVLEVIIPEVPIYLWYLNCALTSETMVLGYWNDHGYPGLIPGGNSSTGHYWAVTEQLQLLQSDSRMGGYSSAAELGLNYRFGDFYVTSNAWQAYTNAIDTYQSPLSLVWTGPPYGAHATVGVGYKIDAAQRFLILHDTWVNTPAYVNYDQYYSSLVGIGCFQPTPGSPQSNSISPLSPSPGPLDLRPHPVQFEPPLNFAEMAYHAIDSADINGDGRPDLVVTSFRNNYWQPRLLLYTNAQNRFVLDSRFAPSLIWYEDLHVVKTLDCDGDGDLDVVTGGFWANVCIYTNQAGVLSSTPLVINTGDYSFDLDWGDIDLDGDPDLAVIARGQVQIFRNDSMTFTLVDTIGCSRGAQVKLRNLAGTPHPELIFSGHDGSVVVYQNNNGTFARPAIFAPAGHGARSFDIADVDKDGDADIVTVHDGRLVLFRNNAGVLDPVPIYLTTTQRFFASDLHLADLDADGFPELLAACYNSQDAVFANLGGSFTSTPDWVTPDRQASVRVRPLCLNAASRPVLGLFRPRGCPVEFFDVLKHPTLGQPLRAGDQCTFTIADLLPGSSNCVQRSFSLAPPAWTDVGSFLSPGRQTNWSDRVEPAWQKVFYRVAQ